MVELRWQVASCGTLLSNKRLGRTSVMRHSSRMHLACFCCSRVETPHSTHQRIYHRWQPQGFSGHEEQGVGCWVLVCTMDLLDVYKLARDRFPVFQGSATTGGVLL